MAFGNNAYPMLQAEQQARAEQLAALGQNPNMRRAGAVMGDLGSAANTIYRAFDPINPIVAGREMYESGARFKDSVGDLAKVSGAQVGGFLANMGRQYANRIDQQAGLNTPQRQMVPVPSRQQILSPALSPQPYALSGPAFAPASPAPMPQGALAAEAQQRATPATRSRNTPAAPPMPQERQANLAQAMASPETLQAVAEAGSVRGGKSEPLKKRGGFSPENMGMIAFGLTLMTGGDMTEALNNGLTVHGNLDAMRDEKEQKAASQELLKNVPKEYVPALNALIASKQFDKVAGFNVDALQKEEAARAAEKAAAEQQAADFAQRQALSAQVAKLYPGVSQELIQSMPIDDLSKMIVDMPMPDTGDEQADTFKMATREMDYLNSATNQAVSVLDKAIRPVEEFLSGGLPLKEIRAGIGSNIPGSLGAELKAALKSAKAFTSFSTLQQMRENSPTGGALGNVSNVELDLLQNAMGALDIGMGLPELLANLQEIKRRVIEQQSTAQRYYSEDFGLASAAVEPVQQPTQSGSGELLGTYGNAKVYAR